MTDVKMTTLSAYRDSAAAARGSSTSLVSAVSHSQLLACRLESTISVERLTNVLTLLLDQRFHFSSFMHTFYKIGFLGFCTFTQISNFTYS